MVTRCQPNWSFDVVSARGLAFPEPSIRAQPDAVSRILLARREAAPRPTVGTRHHGVDAMEVTWEAERRGLRWPSLKTSSRARRYVCACAGVFGRPKTPRPGMERGSEASSTGRDVRRVGGRAADRGGSQRLDRQQGLKDRAGPRGGVLAREAFTTMPTFPTASVRLDRGAL